MREFLEKIRTSLSVLRTLLRKIKLSQGVEVAEQLIKEIESRMDESPLTEDKLKELGFGKCEGRPFENIDLDYWAKDAVLLFYNTSPPYNTYLVGYGEMRWGKYQAVTFKWINKVYQLKEVYDAVTGKTL